MSAPEPTPSVEEPAPEPPVEPPVEEPPAPDPEVEKRKEAVLAAFRSMVPEEEPAAVETLEFRVRHLEAAVTGRRAEDQEEPTWDLSSPLGPYTERFVGSYDEAVRRAQRRAGEMAAYQLGYDVVRQRIREMAEGAP